MKWREKMLVLPVLFYYSISGVCLGIGAIVPWLWWLVVFGIALFLWTVNYDQSGHTAFFGGWMAFSIKLLFAISWFLTTYPIKLIEFSLGRFEILVVIFYWLTVSLAIGLSGGLLAIVLFLIAKRFSTYLCVVLAMIIWIPAEILGALFFSIFTYGSGGTINTVYTFGYSGYLLAQHPLLFKLASFGGVFILSFVAVLLGASLYYCFSYYKKYPILIKVGLSVSLLFIGTIFLPTVSEQKEGGIKVAIVDTRIGGDTFYSLVPEEREELRAKQLIEATKTALQTGAEYVVMSEDSRYFPIGFSPDRAYALFRFQQANTDAVVIDAGPAPISPTTVALRTNIYDGKGKKVYVADKQYLVPQGEFMPNFYLTFFKLFVPSDSIDKFKQKFNYRPGPLVDQSKFPDYIPGIIYCFSDSDPLAVARLVKERKMPFVAHPISHAWFHSPESLWFQYDTMLRIQARWNKTAIISAGNMVKGALYNKDGEKIIPQVVDSGDYWTVSLVTL